MKLILSLSLLLIPIIDLHAQATRTWVSGVGDDANPCSRTAPGKTFAGAISKTAAGGEISVLDPGGFGAVNITKSMTIDGDGTLAGILATGTNGIIVNAGVNDVVVIRNISIKNPGGGIASPSGLHGIKVLQAGAVHVENCTIVDGTDCGISFQPANAGAKLFVVNTTFDNCKGVGVKIAPVTSGFATISNSHIQRCGTGVYALPGAKVTLVNSLVTSSTSNGFLCIGASEGNVVNSTISYNGGTGVASGNAGGTGTIVRISNSNVLNNTSRGLYVNGSELISLGNNTVLGNSPDGTPTSTVTLK